MNYFQRWSKLTHTTVYAIKSISPLGRNRNKANPYKNYNIAINNVGQKITIS